MQRREFIGSTLSATLMSPIVSALAQDAARATYDFVIIGAGTAGLPAAIFASRRGAKVLLIDSAPVIGGTLHLANGQISAGGSKLQKAKGIVDTPDKHFDDIMWLSRGKADANVSRLTADHAPDTINWLLDAGLKPLSDHPVTGDQPGRPAYRTPRYLWAEKQGKDILAVIEKELAPEIAKGNVVTVLDTRVSQLLTDESGRVVGVKADQKGVNVEFRGRHVLLTTGGYAMNAKLFQELIGAPAYASGSYPYALGDGLKLVTDIGGGLRGRDMHRPGPGSILTSDQFPAKFYARFNLIPQNRQPWEIWVNNAGERFVREDEPETYIRERGLVTQPEFRYAVMFDDAIFKASPPGILNWSREKMNEHFNVHSMFHKADTLEALAAKARINVDGLKATIAAYNKVVAGAPDPFGRQHAPQKIGEGPYYAITHLGHSATSAIGVTIDAQMRVTRPDGTAIAGLYAAGEVMGSGATLGDAFVPGMMLTPALVLGRWLGMTLPVGKA
jgi:fumarate reductase flavoprotein subunit